MNIQREDFCEEERGRTESFHGIRYTRHAARAHETARSSDDMERRNEKVTKERYEENGGTKRMDDTYK